MLVDRPSDQVQTTYRARNCSNAWLIETVKEFVVFQLQVERDCVQACDADEDQVDIDVIEDKFDDRHEGVWNRC